MSNFQYHLWRTIEKINPYFSRTGFIRPIARRVSLRLGRFFECVRAIRFCWRFPKLFRKFYTNPKLLDRLKEFERHLLKMPLPVAQIDHGVAQIWSSDTWTVETCRCLYAPHRYFIPIQFRYADAPRFFFHIPNAVYRKLQMFEALSQIAYHADHLFVCEVGRGLDLLLASELKQWKSIRVYDYNSLHEAPIMSFFSSLPVSFFQADSTQYDFSQIEQKCILLADNPYIQAGGLKQIQENENIICALISGNLIKSPNTKAEPKL